MSRRLIGLSFLLLAACQNPLMTEGGDLSNPYSDYPLAYAGGYTQTAPRIYLVLWGKNWTNGGDSAGVAATLTNFYQGIGGSRYANALKEYPGDTTAYRNPTGQLRGTWKDSSFVSVDPTQDEIKAEVSRAVQRFSDKGANAQYIVALPWGTYDRLARNKGWCGWHTTLTTTASGKWATFTVLNYTPYLIAAGLHDCAGGSDAPTVLASHEYVETVTDPNFAGWRDDSRPGGEIADKCQRVNNGYVQLSNGLTFLVTSIWSNQARADTGDGCPAPTP